MYLLDTNHCSGAILGNANILRRLAETENIAIATCVVVQGELNLHGRTFSTKRA